MKWRESDAGSWEGRQEFSTKPQQINQQWVPRVQPRLSWWQSPVILNLAGDRAGWSDVPWPSLVCHQRNAALQGGCWVSAVASDGRGQVSWGLRRGFSMHIVGAWV